MAVAIIDDHVRTQTTIADCRSIRRIPISRSQRNPIILCTSEAETCIGRPSVKARSRATRPRSIEAHRRGDHSRARPLDALSLSPSLSLVLFLPLSFSRNLIYLGCAPGSSRFDLPGCAQPGSASNAPTRVAYY